MSIFSSTFAIQADTYACSTLKLAWTVVELLGNTRVDIRREYPIFPWYLYSLLFSEWNMPKEDYKYTYPRPANCELWATVVNRSQSTNRAKFIPKILYCVSRPQAKPPKHNFILDHFRTYSVIFLSPKWLRRDLQPATEIRHKVSFIANIHLVDRKEKD